MRLTYLDETGSDWTAPYFGVAGVLVHGDKQWPEIDRRIASLVERHVSSDKRSGFIFHATDIFHGSRYFDRHKPEWNTPDKRHAVLDELAEIIRDLSLPVVFGIYKKEGFGASALPADSSLEHRHVVLHNVSAVDCLIRADRWLAEYAPDELSTVVHEDKPKAKRFIKHALRTCRDPAAVAEMKLPADIGLPLKRIIDTIHFAEKADAPPLQLADLCAFIIGRVAKQEHVPEKAGKIVINQLEWIRKFFPPRASGPLSPSGGRSA